MLLHRLLYPNASLDLLKICEQCNATWGDRFFLWLFLSLSFTFFVFPVTFFHFLPLADSLSKKYRQAHRRWLGGWRSRRWWLPDLQVGTRPCPSVALESAGAGAIWWARRRWSLESAGARAIWRAHRRFLRPDHDFNKKNKKNIKKWLF